MLRSFSFMISRRRRNKRRKKSRVSMGELARTINRKSGTIRKWEASGFLPEHLIPHRDSDNHRWWTKDQVHGPDGIIAWMEENDLRPGRLMADPDNEDRHIQSLRKPKYITGDMIRGIKIMVANDRSYDYIIGKTYPRTRYTTQRGFERSLVRYFRSMGWDFPRKPRKPYPPPHLRMGKPGPKKRLRRRRRARS